ncbi:hypothetical protein ACQEVB_06555 [Pseudonocardia sp. CA-107938]|uniref:hypothetical protein n=1 Tax=Pseudonocardia sp. CA-107938 TaxID=3240021 RepID=UPI003D91D12F
MGTVVLGMEIAAVAFAVYGFGWLVLLIGVPLIVGTLLIVLVATVSERNRRIRQERAEQAEQARKLDPEGTVYLGRGLMSGFFELPGLPARPDGQQAAPPIPTQPGPPPAPGRIHH